MHGKKYVLINRNMWTYAGGIKYFPKILHKFRTRLLSLTCLQIIR